MFKALTTTAIVTLLALSGTAAYAQESEASAMENYGQLLNQHIARFNEYPQEAFDNGVEGTPIIYLQIDAQGKLLSEELVQSSGSQLLDDAAMKAINSANPFPPIPQGSFPETGAAEFTVPILYMQ